MQPLAFLLTFRTYGTWLPGDARGSLSRHYRGFDTARRGVAPALERAAAASLRGGPRQLPLEDRERVAFALRGALTRLGLVLHRLHVGAEHVHVVVSAPAWRPNRLTGFLKGTATAALRAAGRVGARDPVWARGGSTRYLRTEQALVHASAYVHAHAADN